MLFTFILCYNLVNMTEWRCYSLVLIVFWVGNINLGKFCYSTNKLKFYYLFYQDHISATNNGIFSQENPSWLQSKYELSDFLINGYFSYIRLTAANCSILQLVELTKSFQAYPKVELDWVWSICHQFLFKKCFHSIKFWITTLQFIDRANQQCK